MKDDEVREVVKGHVIFQAVRRQLFKVCIGVVPAVFVVDKVTIENLESQHFRFVFSLYYSITPIHHVHIHSSAFTRCSLDADSFNKRISKTMNFRKAGARKICVLVRNTFTHF